MKLTRREHLPVGDTTNLVTCTVISPTSPNIQLIQVVRAVGGVPLVALPVLQKNKKKQQKSKAILCSPTPAIFSYFIRLLCAFSLPFLSWDFQALKLIQNHTIKFEKGFPVYLPGSSLPISSFSLSPPHGLIDFPWVPRRYFQDSRTPM